MSLTVGSLFSGIGGIDLGLERAGMRVLWQVENDPYCCAVLARHWPDVPRYGDVKELDPDDLAPVDLVCGGFPCQPVSRAGRRMAQADERWLWPEFARVVRGIRPRYVFVENVPGLLVHGMGDVLGDLASLGFDAEWESIPAAAVGAPHLRDRVWIVANANGQRFGGRRVSVVGNSADAGQRGARQGQTPMADSAGHRLGATRGADQDAGYVGVGSEPTVADADGERREERRGAVAGGPPLAGPEHGGQVDDALGGRHRAPQAAVFAGGPGPEPASWWATEPDVGRVAHGVPARVDRLRALGNAVVPQVAEWIGRRIVEADAAQPLPFADPPVTDIATGGRT